MIATDISPYGSNFLWYKDDTELGETGIRSQIDGLGRIHYVGTGWFCISIEPYGKLPF